MNCNPAYQCAKDTFGPCVGEVWATVQKEAVERTKSYVFLSRQYAALQEKERPKLEDEAKKLKKRADEKLMETKLNTVHSKTVSELLRKRIPAILASIDEAKEEREAMAAVGLFTTAKAYHYCKLGTKVYHALRRAGEAAEDAGRVAEDDLTRPADLVPMKRQYVKVDNISASIAGRQGEIWAHLRDEGCRVVGVHGVGGVGKSTLLKLVNNELCDDIRGFDVVIFLSISNNSRLQVHSIQMDLAKRIGKESLFDNKNLTDDDRARYLRNSLQQEFPKFLIFLDDVWKEFDVREIGIPSPEEEPFHGKLILSSRFDEKCRRMGAEEKNLVVVSKLEPPEAWNLFCKQLLPDALKAVEAADEHAKAVFDMCDRLPLALCVIGRAAKSLKTGWEWSDFRRRMENSLSSPEEVQEELLQKLKISYDLLDPPEPLQRCLLYCSLFPEDYSIRMGQLAKYWAAEEFLSADYCQHSEKLLGETTRLCRKLEEANLLEFGDSESEVKLHDEIHRMAQWIASQPYQDRHREEPVKEIFVVHAGGSAEEDGYDDVDYFQSRASRISLMRSCVQEDLLPPQPDCPNLMTLLLQDNPLLSKLPDAFFDRTPALKVLDLSNTRIRELPISDGSLPLLQYLSLRGTGIIRLPAQLRCLKKLRHLDLAMTYSLVSIPVGVFTGFEFLELLDLHNSHYGRWRAKEETGGDGGEAAVEELTRLKKLQELAIMVQSMKVVQEISDSRILRRSLRSLTVEYGEAGLDLLYISDFWPLAQVEDLAIHSCYRLQKVLLGDTKREKNKSTTWRPPEKPGLRVITFAVLSNLSSFVIPSAVRMDQYLKDLREVNIESCPKLRNLNWIQQLQHLQKLKISDCELIEEVVEEDRRQEAFKELKVILLSELPLLEIICSEMDFPSLESIRVQDCPNLWKLPFKSNYTAPTLRHITGHEEWWSELKWPGEKLHLNLEPFFREI